VEQNNRKISQEPESEISIRIFLHKCCLLSEFKGTRGMGTWGNGRKREFEEGMCQRHIIFIEI